MTRHLAPALICLIGGSAALNAQISQPAQPQGDSPSTPRPFVVALSVKDVQASAQWYVETLGFKVFFPIRDAQRGRLHATLELNGFFIDLISRPKAVTRDSVMPDSREPASLTGIYRFGVVVPDLDKIVRQQRDRGKRVATQVDGGWGIRWCDLEDPDGNSVWAVQQIYAVKPAA